MAVELDKCSAGASGGGARPRSTSSGGAPRRGLRAILVLAASVAAAVLLLSHSFLGHSSSGSGASLTRRLGQPGAPSVGAQAIHGPQSARYVDEEHLLRALTEECSKGEDTVIYLDGSGSMVVEKEVDTTQCPLVDIMLRGQERGVGTCTDVALYVMHVGGRIIPMQKQGGAYSRACGARTARMLLETMYSEFFVSPPAAGAGILYMQLVNSEHLWEADAGLHARIGLFLCKTAFCARLMKAHVAKKGWTADVRMVGHTSSDPTVDLPQGVTRAKSGFLHVKGKSGLKHTNQLLECWGQHPEFPTLHVVGRFKWDEVAAVRGATNLRFYPKVTVAAEDQATEHVSFQDIRNLQAQMPIHICPSEREGFGHYINEARAASATILSTNHPPMNELVTPSSGILLDPERVGSYPMQALRERAAINAYLSPGQICGGVAAALAMTPEDLETRGRAARDAYLRGRADNAAALGQLRAFLTERRAKADRVLAAAIAAAADAAKYGTGGGPQRPGQQ